MSEVKREKRERGEIERETSLELWTPPVHIWSLNLTNRQVNIPVSR